MAFEKKIFVRTNEYVHSRVFEAARIKGESVNKFAIHVLLDAAEEVIDQASRINDIHIEPRADDADEPEIESEGDDAEEKA